VPVRQQEVEGAEARELARGARRLAERLVGGGRGGLVGDAGLVEPREQPREEHLAVGLPVDLGRALDRSVLPQPADLLDRAVVGEDPPTLREGMRVDQRRLADRLLPDVRDEHPAPAADREAVEVLVLARAGDALVDAPSARVVVDRQAPAVAVLPRQRGERARGFLEDDLEVGGFARGDPE
jgi:hypothetical protein